MNIKASFNGKTPLVIAKEGCKNQRTSLIANGANLIRPTMGKQL
jgi:hypothetical protein